MDNKFVLDWIRPVTKFNIHETDYKEVSMQFMQNIQSLKLGHIKVEKSLLRRFEVTQADSLITFESFGETEDEYWNIEDTWTFWDLDSGNETDTMIMHGIVLADDKQVIKKTNIDLIQLIEKTGGFHDGLVLVFSGLISPIAAS